MGTLRARQRPDGGRESVTTQINEGLLSLKEREDKP